MTSATGETTPKPRLAFQAEANEFGQITGLDAGATYFVVRRPTKELTQEKSREFVDDLKAFLQERKVLSEQQVKDINSKYAEPAKAKAQELREVVEKRFDELTREFESRVARIESELNERADRLFKNKGGNGDETPAAPTNTSETPGEMPRGDAETTPEFEAPTPADAAQDEIERADGKGRKKTGKK